MAVTAHSLHSHRSKAPPTLRRLGGRLRTSMDRAATPFGGPMSDGRGRRRVSRGDHAELAPPMLLSDSWARIWSNPLFEWGLWNPFSTCLTPRYGLQTISSRSAPSMRLSHRSIFLTYLLPALAVNAFPPNRQISREKLFFQIKGRRGGGLDATSDGRRSKCNGY